MGGYYGAALKGLGCYIFLILFVLHLFVAWKFDKEYEGMSVIIKYQNDPIPDPPKAIEGLPTQSTVARLLVELEESQSKAKAESSTAKSQVEDLLASYQSTLRNWEYWDTINDNGNDSAGTKNPISLLPEGRKPIKIVSFVSLLMKASLADMEDHDDLTASFQSSLREFQGLADHRSEVKWDIISDLLLYTNSNSKSSAEEFPAKEKVSNEDLYEQVCRLTALKEEDFDSLAEVGHEEEDDEDLDLSIFVTKDDLKMQYQLMEAMLEKRSDSSLEDYLSLKGNATISRAIKESLAILQQEVKDAQFLADETIESIRAAEAESGVEVVEEEESEEECDMEPVLETVRELLETGLDAIQRKKDVRAAILEKLEEIEPLVAKDLALDNAIESDIVAHPEMGPKAAINVRKIIDTPLLRHSTLIIDWFFDWVSLHTHELDKLIDKLNLPTTTTPGATSGELLAAYMLQIMGTLSIPIPPRVHEIMLQTERGRHLLTAYS